MLYNTGSSAQGSAMTYTGGMGGMVQEGRYPFSWLTLLYSRNEHIVKQLYANLKKFFLKSYKDIFYNTGNIATIL